MKCRNGFDHWFGVVVITALVTSTKLSIIEPGYSVSTGINDHLWPVYHSGIFSGALSLAIPPLISAMITWDGFGHRGRNSEFCIVVNSGQLSLLPSVGRGMSSISVSLMEETVSSSFAL